jgi:hypothetical protein
MGMDSSPRSPLPTIGQLQKELSDLMKFESTHKAAESVYVRIHEILDQIEQIERAGPQNQDAEPKANSIAGLALALRKKELEHAKGIAGQASRRTPPPEPPGKAAEHPPAGA